MKNKNAIKGYVSLAYTCTEQSGGLEQSEGCISFSFIQIENLYMYSTQWGASHGYDT